MAALSSSSLLRKGACKEERGGGGEERERGEEERGRVYIRLAANATTVLTRHAVPSTPFPF